MTLSAWCFWWVTVSLLVVGAWCAYVEAGIWWNRRRVERRRAARRGYVGVGPYDRERLR